MGSILENGLVRQQQLGVSSTYNRILFSFCVNFLTDFRALSNNHDASDLRVYITGDGSEVYEDSFLAIAKPDGSAFKPTLILVGTRLGIDKVTPAYWEALKKSVQMEQSIGIAG